MDRLDRISLLLLLLFAVAGGAVALVHQNREEFDLRAPTRSRATAPVIPTVPAPEIAAVSRLVSSGSLEVAERRARALVATYPDAGAGHMLLGDIFMRRQDLRRAVLAFREAILRNPDYLDKSAPEYQGKKLKHVVDEAVRALETDAGAAATDRTQQRRYQAVLHYMQRKIAGSCG